MTLLESVSARCSSRFWLNNAPNTVRVIKSTRLGWADHVARIEEGRSAFKILTGTPIRNRPLGSPRCGWEDNIRMDFKGIDIDTRKMV